MRWPWRRHDGIGADSADAHREAAEHLKEATARWPEVRRVSKSLRDLRERNHFAAQIEMIFREGHK